MSIFLPRMNRSLKEFLRHILSAHSERYRKPQHDRSEDNSECKEHCLISQSEFLEHHRHHEDDDETADRNAQKARRGKIRVDCREQMRRAKRSSQ